MSSPNRALPQTRGKSRVAALRIVFAIMLIAIGYLLFSFWRLLRLHGALLPGTGFASGTAVAANVLGCVLSFLVSGEWILKTIFAVVFFLACLLLLIVGSMAHGAVGGFPGVLLLC